MANTFIDIPNLSETARTYYLKGCWNSPGNGSEPIDDYAGFKYTLLMGHFRTESGTCNVTMEINNGSGWVAVTGLTNVPVTSSGVNSNATADRSVNLHGRLRMTVSSNVDAVKLAFSIEVQEYVA